MEKKKSVALLQTSSLLVMAQQPEERVLVDHTEGTDVCYHEHLPGNKVKCLVCAHQCVISPGSTGCTYCCNSLVTLLQVYAV